jgi:hypothetical protein
MELLFLISLVCIVFFRTIYFQIIVDDIRLLDQIQKGSLGGKWTAKNFLQRIASRLYGTGTWARIGKCSTCRGTRNIDAFGDDSRKTIPCPACKGTGKAWMVSLKEEHATTLVLHTLATCLVYLALGHNQVSFFAAILYAVHPTNLQTSVWMNGRRYLVNVIIVLLMALLGPAGLLLYLITPLFQVTAIFAPVMYGWWGILVSGAMLLYAWPRFIRGKVKSRLDQIYNLDMKIWHRRRIIIIVKTMGFYLLQMTVPSRTMMVYPLLANWGLNKDGNDEAYRCDLYFYAGLVGLGVLAVGPFLLSGQERWWLILLGLATLQQCNIIPATQVIADRYCSVPTIFMTYFVAKFAGPIGSTILGLYYLNGLFSALPLFQDIHQYYNYHLFYDPKGIIVRKFKVNWLLKTGDIIGAWELIKVGLTHNPGDFSMNYQAAVCMAQMGDKKAFESYLDKAELNGYLGQESQWVEHLKQMRASMGGDNGKHHPPQRHAHEVIDFARRMK